MSNGSKPITVNVLKLSKEDKLWTAVCTWEDVFDFLDTPSRFLRTRLFAPGADSPSRFNLGVGNATKSVVLFSFPPPERENHLKRLGHDALLQGINGTNVVIAFGLPSWSGESAEAHFAQYRDQFSSTSSTKGGRKSVRRTDVLIDTELGYASTHVHLRSRDEGIQLIAKILADPIAFVDHLNRLTDPDIRVQIHENVDGKSQLRGLYPLKERVRWLTPNKHQLNALRILYQDVPPPSLPCHQSTGATTIVEVDGITEYQVAIDQCLVKPYVAATAVLAPRK